MPEASSVPDRGMRRVLRVCDFGSTILQYGEGLQLQRLVGDRIRATGASDVLLQLQHPPVITLGKRGADKDLRTPSAELQAQGIAVVPIPRGGEATLHAPGQLVLYPLLELHRLRYGARRYIEGLEDFLIALCAERGIQAKGRQKCRTGVWVGDQKIAAIGVRISRGSTTHGAALNVCNDLGLFRHIVPCGIADKGVTSLAAETGAPVSVQDVSRRAAELFASQFGYTELESLSREQLAEA